MRKIVVEFTLPEGCEERYKDTCAEIIIERFLDEDIDMRILSDVVITEKGKTNITIKNL